jgi:hypothetical protein
LLAHAAANTEEQLVLQHQLCNPEEQLVLPASALQE